MMSFKNVTFRNLNDIFDINDSEHVTPDLDIAYESVIDGDSTPAKEHLANLFYNELRCVDEYKGPKVLFRFAGLTEIEEICKETNTANEKREKAEKDYVITDIRNNAVTLSNPSKFNDPMDPILRVWLKLKEKEYAKGHDTKFFSLATKAIGRARIACFCGKGINPTINDCNPLMWAHYTKSHKGICIEYEFTAESISAHNDDEHVLLLHEVRYREYKAMSDYITLDNALVAKADCWSYEYEKRLIYFSKKDAYKKEKDYVSLSGFKIRAVYMGYRIDNLYESILKKLCNTKNIPLYKMEFDMNDITKLKAKSIYI